MIRRLALGIPYSKPSTAEDSLPHPASRRRFAGLYEASIGAVRALCNAREDARTGKNSNGVIAALVMQPFGVLMCAVATIANRQ